MKDLIVLVGGVLFLYFISSQIGCLLQDIFEDNDSDDNESY